MSDFLNQLPALVGVLVGTTGTIVATTVADRARWHRAQSVRWDDRRLDAYATYARVLKEIHAVLLAVTAGVRTDARTPPRPRDEAVAALAEGNRRHSIEWESLLLLGDADTVAAAQAWRQAIYAFHDAALAEPIAADAIGPLVRAVDEARDGFYRAARASLAVGGGDVAQLPWLDGRRGI